MEAFVCGWCLVLVNPSWEVTPCSLDINDLNVQSRGDTYSRAGQVKQTLAFTCTFRSLHSDVGGRD